MKIIHASDIHLGFQAFDKHSGGYNTRELDVYREFLSFLSRVTEIGPDVVIIAGDLFDGIKPPNKALRLSLMLGDLPCPVIVISGNHDQARTGEESPVEILRSVGVEVFSEPGRVSIGGLDFFCAPFECELEPADVLVGHLQISGPREYNFARTVKIEAENYAYCALGDLHYYWTKENIIYSGSLSRLDFSQEKIDVGFLEVTLSNTEDGSIVRHTMPSREFVTISDIAQFRDQIARDSIAYRDKVVRIIVNGDTLKEEQIEECLSTLEATGLTGAPFHTKIVRKKLKVVSVEGEPEAAPITRTGSILEDYKQFSLSQGKEHLIGPGVQLLEEHLRVQND